MENKRSLLALLMSGAVRFIFKRYFTLFHRIRIEGVENVPKKFDKLIIIANHASLLDGLIVWTYIKVPLKIIVNRGRSREWLFRPFMRNDYTVPIDAMNPYEKHYRGSQPGYCASYFSRRAYDEYGKSYEDL
jgi:acyl-[acyl-carrier-protein]-phospholipid O-acyltransferase/long-chain-fatty-acid--[acyl-carrier-protein] ligase